MIFERTTMYSLHNPYSIYVRMAVYIYIYIYVHVCVCLRPKAIAPKRQTARPGAFEDGPTSPLKEPFKGNLEPLKMALYPL